MKNYDFAQYVQCWNTYKRSDLQIIEVVKAVEAVEETDFQVLLKV